MIEQVNAGGDIYVVVAGGRQSREADPCPGSKVAVAKAEPKARESAWEAAARAVRARIVVFRIISGSFRRSRRGTPLLCGKASLLEKRQV